MAFELSLKDLEDFWKYHKLRFLQHNPFCERYFFMLTPVVAQLVSAPGLQVHGSFPARASGVRLVLDLMLLLFTSVAYGSCCLTLLLGPVD